MLYGAITNTAAILSLTSSLVEAGESGLRNARHNARTAVAVKDIKNISGDMKLNKSSEKHLAMKKMVRKFDLGNGISKAGGAITGFADGFAEGMKGNLIPSGLAILTLLSKNKVIKLASTVLMGGFMTWDFVKNGTNLFTKKDDIEK